MLLRDHVPWDELRLSQVEDIARHCNDACAVDAVSLIAEVRRLRRGAIPERTPDGHPQVWCLYQPEPFAPGSDDDRSIHLWVRRVNVFTSQAGAVAFLDNLLGEQVSWRKYNELFPELWIGVSRSGHRWLMTPAPVDPPGGQR